MNTKTNCCGGTATVCDSTIAELPRYYPRQLITPEDLTLEQNYFRDRMRRHNRLLHGWGVVCGALVCPVTVTNADGSTSFRPWLVTVQTGYALGPYGDEIILDCTRTVDLRTSGCSGVTGEPCIDAPDPWCSQVFTPPTTTNVLYIAVKYKQCMMRPVRVQPIGCGCDDSSCEYSRWHDGYEIGVLQTCPVCNACDPNITPALTPATAGSLVTGGIPGCPDCSCGPWVCLAKVTVNPDGSLAQIDNCTCRRLVVSLSTSWWQAQCPGTNTSVTGVTGPDPKKTPVPVPPDGQTVVNLTVAGKNLEIGPGVTYSFGSGITVTVSGQTGALQTGLSSVTLAVTAQPTAAPGVYNLTIVNPECSVVVFGNAINVNAPAALSGLAKPTPAAVAATRVKPAPKPAKAEVAKH
jgi:hypothetical protein